MQEPACIKFIYWLSQQQTVNAGLVVFTDGIKLGGVCSPAKMETLTMIGWASAWKSAASECDSLGADTSISGVIYEVASTSLDLQGIT